MLNQSTVVVTQGTTRKTILIDLNNTTSVSCIVSDDGVSAVEGKKMILAGTPLTGDLTKRDVPFTVVTGVDAVADEGEEGDAVAAPNAVGILLHDVEVTAGQANAQIVIFGFVDITKLDDSVVSMLTEEVQGSLNMIKFIG